MLEYAPLRSRTGLPSLRGWLYYAQRVVTQPAMRRAAARMIAAGINFRQSRARPYPCPERIEAIARLRRDGFAVVPSILSSAQIDDILAFLGNKPLVLRDGRCLGVNKAQLETTIADTPLDVVLDCPHVLAAANSAFLIDLAVDYLGCLPTISTIGIRWSFPGSDASAQTQNFHRDPDDWRFFKFFVYLTDVDQGCGPHTYVKGSHLHAGTVRARPFELAELERRYGADAIVAVTGPRGTNFVADTYGIHAGPVPAARPRLILEVGYSVLPIFALSYQPRTGGTSQGLDPYVNRLLMH